jgi:hypothetical protein
MSLSVLDVVSLADLMAHDDGLVSLFGTVGQAPGARLGTNVRLGEYQPAARWSRDPIQAQSLGQRFVDATDRK